MHVNKKKKKTSKNSPPKKLYLVNHWAGYITSPGLHERLLWQSSRPSRWHPQHMWHDLLQRGYTGAPSHCANSRQGPQMCVAPLGHGSRMRCPSLCSSADAPHNCQAFSFIRPRSDTYRGVQPEAITAASLRCGHTHTRTCTDIYIDTCTFGIISKKEPISSVERCDGEGFLLFFFFSSVFWICARGEIKPSWHEGVSECAWIQKSFHEHRGGNLFQVWPNYDENRQYTGMSFKLVYISG